MQKSFLLLLAPLLEQDLHHGQEIYLFFGKYQTAGMVGIFVSSTLMGILIYKIFTLSKQKNIQNYEQFIDSFQVSKTIKNVIQIIMSIFLLISFYVMIAGFSAYFLQEWQIPTYIGTGIILLLCYKIFMGNIETLMKVNTLLVPILVLAIVFLTYKNQNAISLPLYSVSKGTMIEAMAKAIIYTSYNSIVLIPMLLSLSKCIKKQTDITIISVVCIILLILLALSIFALLQTINIDINKIELPTIYIAGQMNKNYQILFGIVILASIYTSAISAGYGFLEKYKTNEKQYKTKVILLCGMAFLVSKIGFSTLVNLLYPICGLLGLLQMILILKKQKKT